MLNLHLDDLSWDYQFQFSAYIDFCIWVLEIDGLHVAPFSHHLQGDSALQARGLNAYNWQLWLAKVVELEDPWLGWREESKDRQSWIEEQLADFEMMASLVDDKIDVPVVRAALQRRWLWREQQYQQAVARFEQLPGTPKDFSPPDIWTGELAVGQLIRELWQSYQKIWDERRREVLESELRRPGTQQIEKMKKLQNDLQPYKTRLTGLNIYVVNYPIAVEYLVPPKSVLLSVANGLLDSDTFYECVLRAAEELAKISS